MAKALDLLDHTEKAFHESSHALGIMDKLIALRKEQSAEKEEAGVFYESLIASFYFRAGDHLATYILMNTDELGTVKPFSEEPDSDGGEGEQAAGTEPEELAAPAEGIEETKQEAPATMMINTSAPAAPKNDENAVLGAEPKNEEDSYE